MTYCATTNTPGIYAESFCNMSGLRNALRYANSTIHGKTTCALTPFPPRFNRRSFHDPPEIQHLLWQLKITRRWHGFFASHKIFHEKEKLPFSLNGKLVSTKSFRRNSIFLENSKNSQEIAESGNYVTFITLLCSSVISLRKLIFNPKYPK